MTKEPRPSIFEKVTAPLVVVVLGTLLVGGSSPWWLKFIFPTPTPIPGATITPTSTPTSGPTLITIGPTTPPTSPPTVGPNTGCVLTITNPFATISEEPSHDSTEIGDVPAGDYATSDTRMVDWAGRDERWFQITASGRTGWIGYNTIMVESKSAECL